MQFTKIKLNIQRFSDTLGPINNSGTGSSGAVSAMKMKIVVSIATDVGVYVHQLIHYRNDEHQTQSSEATEYINGSAVFSGYVNFAPNSSEKTTYSNYNPGFLISGTGYKTIRITFTSGVPNVAGAVFETSVYVPETPTRYVYYNQGNASNNTNLPATQSARQGASLILATNRMTRNPYTLVNTISFYVEDINRGNKECYVLTTFWPDGWATSKDGAFAYTNGQSVTMGSSDMTLYPYFTQREEEIPLVLPTLDELQIQPPLTNKELDGWYTQGYVTKVGDAGDSIFLSSGTALFAKLIDVSNIQYNPDNTGFTTTNVYLSTNGGNFNLITADKIKKL